MSITGNNKKNTPKKSLCSEKKGTSSVAKALEKKTASSVFLLRGYRKTEEKRL